MIYFIQSENGGPIKIGYATDAERRLATLQTGNPEKLVLLLVVDGTIKEEKRIHAHFRKHRVHGEWFRDCEEIRKFMASRSEITSVKKSPKPPKPQREPDIGKIIDDEIHSMRDNVLLAGNETAILTLVIFIKHRIDIRLRRYGYYLSEEGKEYVEDKINQIIADATRLEIACS